MKYTQKQLEEMSDFELSAAILNIKFSRIICESFPTTTSESEAACELSVMERNRCNDAATFDVNNWKDMGPLMRANKISIDYYGSDDPSAHAWVPYGFIGSSSSTELRAVAIVYILIKQGVDAGVDERKDAAVKLTTNKSNWNNYA